MKIVGCIFFALVLVYIGSALYDQSKWVETSATITAATVEKDLSGYTHGIFTPFYIDGQIEYSSPRGKHTFKVSNLRSGMIDRKTADEVARKLLGSKMSIKYNPNKPSVWVQLAK